MGWPGLGGADQSGAGEEPWALRNELSQKDWVDWMGAEALGTFVFFREVEDPMQSARTQVKRKEMVAARGDLNGNSKHGTVPWVTGCVREWVRGEDGQGC